MNIFANRGSVKMYYIYKVTNKTNGKIYIGQTNNFEKRKREHLSDKRNNHQAFKRALNKYGEEGFEWEVIDKCTTKEKINEKEKYYIKYYNSKVPNGYNIANGGEGGSNWNLKPIVMLDLKGNYIKRYDYITECENETGLNHSTICGCCKGKHLRYKDYIFMYEQDYLKNGPRKYIKPENCRKRKIEKYDLNGNYICEYESITKASIETGVARTNISSCLIKKVKSSGGFIWIYKGDKKPTRKIIKRVQIEQYDLNGNLLNKFDSCKEAERCLNLHENSYKVIWKSLQYENRVTYGYIWKKHNPVPSL